VAYDQPGVGARIVRKRTGMITSLEKLTVDHLATLIDEVLTNTDYRNNSHKLQQAINESNGPSVAVDAIEKS
jgi:UDP:flavonoid glycosyltransferase YjiC (YdhE family)